MAITLRELVERQFRAVEAKDLEAVLSFFAQNGILIDPHYPEPRMVGKDAIAEGLRWGFKGMKTFGFTIINYCESGDGQRATVEVSSDHVLENRMALHFQQVFVIETSDGLISRIQAYGPYGPHGLVGIALWLTRLKRGRVHAVKHSVRKT